MPWWLIAIYFGINFIIAVFCSIVFEREGYYDTLSGKKFEYGYKINWKRAITVFIVLAVFGTPIAIVGAVVLTIEG